MGPRLLRLTWFCSVRTLLPFNNPTRSSFYCGDAVGVFLRDQHGDPAVSVIGVTGQSAMTNRQSAISIPRYVPEGGFAGRAACRVGRSAAPHLTRA